MCYYPHCAWPLVGSCSGTTGDLYIFHGYGKPPLALQRSVSPSRLDEAATLWFLWASLSERKFRRWKLLRQTIAYVAAIGSTSTIGIHPLLNP